MDQTHEDKSEGIAVAELELPQADSIPSSGQADLPLLGMHCSACAVRIERALNKAEGVEKANVNFATTRASVFYDPALTDPQLLREVVQKAGYDAIVQPVETPIEETTEDRVFVSLHDAENAAREAEYVGQKRRFLVALAFTIPVAVMAMGGHLLPALEGAFNFPGRAWVELVLTAPVLFWAGREFFVGGWNAARHRAADMNTLVAIGTLAAFLYSVAATVVPSLFSVAPHPHHYFDAIPPKRGMAVEVYYEVAAIVITLILMGRLLEARARAQTGSAIRALMELGAKTARVERDGRELEVPIEKVRVGDLVWVRQARKFPLMALWKAGSRAWMSRC